MDAITTDASLKQINASAATLDGSLTVDGTVAMVSLKSASNGRIDLGGTSSSAAVTQVKLGSATDEDLVSDAPLRSISVGSWTGKTPIAPLIDLPAWASSRPAATLRLGLTSATRTAVARS